MDESWNESFCVSRLIHPTTIPKLLTNVFFSLKRQPARTFPFRIQPQLSSFKRRSHCWFKQWQFIQGGNGISRGLRNWNSYVASEYSREPFNSFRGRGRSFSLSCKVSENYFKLLIISFESVIDHYYTRFCIDFTIFSTLIFDSPFAIYRSHFCFLTELRRNGNITVV